MRALIVGLIVAASLVALPAGRAAAGDFATLETLGWSRDGRYYALGQHGVQDGSGFGYAERVIVDRTTGRVVLSVRRGGQRYEGSAGAAKAVAEVRQATAATMQRLEIPGTIAGTRLYRADRVLPWSHADWGHVHPRAEAAIAVGRRAYRIHLMQEVRGNPALDPYTTRGRFALTLSTSLHKPRVIARRAQFTPEYNHLIHSVWLSPDGRGVAVILAVWSVGFEGPDVRYRPAAALLE